MLVGWFVVFAGAVEIIVAVLGKTDRLPRNHWVGIRTRTTMRDDEMWRAAHRESWALVGVAGLIAIALGFYVVLSEQFPPLWVSLPLLLIPTIAAGFVGQAAAKKELSARD